VEIIPVNHKYEAIDILHAGHHEASIQKKDANHQIQMCLFLNFEKYMIL